MLAPPNTFTIRANVAQPRKLNADSFRARCLAMGYIVAYEKPKDQTPDQSPDRNLHWRSQSLHWQIRWAEKGHHSPDIYGRRSDPRLTPQLTNPS